MRDPYQILEISRDADEETIKKAYKRLSRKYHPDANINNPNKEAAEEKFKEIQQAYQQIMKAKSQGFGTSDYGAYGQYTGGEGGMGSSGEYGNFEEFFGSFFGNRYSGWQNQQTYQQQGEGAEENSKLRAAMSYLQNGYYKEARNVLDQMEASQKNAAWYYYSAQVHSVMKNNISALEHAKRAVAMEPQNGAYQNLLRNIESGGMWYQKQQASYGGQGTSMTGICMKLCIANMICNLCCGGGGFCCRGGAI